MERHKFQPGNDEGRKIDGTIAAEMQKKSVASRLRNKQGQELVRALLERAVTDPDVLANAIQHGYNPKEVSNELAMHARQIEKAQKTGDTKAYSAVMKAAGYDTLNVKTDGPRLLVVDAETLQAAEKWSKKG